MLYTNLLSVVLNDFTHHHLCLNFLQKEMPKVIRQGIDEMLQFGKKSKDKKDRVYTFENAVERYHTFLFSVLKRLLSSTHPISLSLKKAICFIQAVGCKPNSV